MGTPAEYMPATEVRRDDESSISKLNAAAQALKLKDTLNENSSAEEVAKVKAAIKAAVEKI